MKEIIDYRFLTIEDTKSTVYDSWSRVYEYKIVTDFIENTKNSSDIEIHNSAWGTDDIKKWGAAKDHVKFRDNISELCDNNAIHSDIIESNNFKTYHYNIVDKESKFVGRFDYVLNVSVIEHLPEREQIIALNNLYEQVKVGGHFVLTFDYPRVNLNILKKFIGEDLNIEIPKNVLNGTNSVKPNQKYNNLNIVLLIIKKVNNE